MDWLKQSIASRTGRWAGFGIFIMLALICFVHWVSAESGPDGTTKITVQAVLEKTAYRLAEPFTFEVTLSWLGQPGDFEIEPPQSLALEGLEMVQSTNSNETTTLNGRYQVIRRYSYTLIPLVEGAARIGQVQIYYRQKLAGPEGQSEWSDRTSLGTTPLSITVHPPRKKIVLPWSAIGTVVGLIIFFGLFFLFLRRRKTMERPIDEPEVLAPSQQFIETLNSEEHLIIEGEMREYIVRAEKAFFTLIKQTLNRDVTGQSIPDIIASLSDKLGEEDRSTVQNFLEMAHLVKFAGQQPEREEIERMVRALGRCARAFERVPVENETES
ncbi:hypothetical protein JXQ70_00820 [bacterium]|nr:hypothetical protein [bacterium]